MMTQGIASFMGGSSKEQQLRQQEKEKILQSQTPIQKRRERRKGLKGGEGQTGGIGKFATQLGAGALPGAGVADVIGAFPDVEGGYEPGMLVNLQQAKRSFQEGNYKQAATQGIYGALQGLGGAGDVALAASPFAPFALPVAVGAKTVSGVGKKLIQKFIPKKINLPEIGNKINEQKQRGLSASVGIDKSETTRSDYVVKGKEMKNVRYSDYKLEESEADKIMQEARKKHKSVTDKEGNQKPGVDLDEFNVGKFDGVTMYTRNIVVKPEELKGIKGYQGEEKRVKTPSGEDSQKLKDLKESIAKEGYKPYSNPNIIVNHKGEPFVLEGNHRIQEAIDSGRPTIAVDIKYLTTGYRADGPLNPQKLIDENPLTEADLIQHQKLYDKFNFAGKKMQAKEQARYEKEKGIASLPTNNLEVEPSLGLDIMTSTEKSFVKPSKANKVVIQDIYDYFDRPTKLNFDDPKQYNQMLQQAKKDFDYQIKQQVTGLDWYDGDIKETMKLLDEVNPKFKNNQDAKDLTVFLTAILSSGTSVGQDITAATKVVDNYLNTGTVASKNPFSVYTKKEAEKFGKPEKAGEPKAWTAQTNTKALEFANSFIQDKGLRPFLDFLHTPTTRREASQIAEKYGLKPFSGKKDEQIVGANLFGPKIGKFMKNMMGMEGDEVVADIWFTRMMDRHSGNMFKMEAGKKNQNKTPRNVAEMQRNQKFVEDLSSLTGYNKRDIQAVLWYFEQGLYTKLGVKSEPKGYSDAIKSILKGRANDTGGSLPQTNETKIKAKRSEPTKLKKAFGGFVESSNYDHYRLI